MTGLPSLRVSSRARRTGHSNGWWGVLLVLLLAAFAVAPLAYPGFFQAQSGFLPVFNIQNLSAAPNWGRAADFLRGEGKLPYLLAWPFLQLTGSGVTAIKWGYGLAFLLAALAVYVWTRRWLGSKGAVLAAALYTYLPWHLATVYVRGAYAEAWLWALGPLALWAVDQIAKRRPLAGLASAVVVLGTAFWTQPGLALVLTVLVAGYGAVVVARRRRLWAAAGAGLVAALTLFVPLGPRAPEPVLGSLLYPFQLFSAGWGNGQSYQLGVAAVGLAIVGVALAAGKRARGGRGRVLGEAPTPEGLESLSHDEVPAQKLSTDSGNGLNGLDQRRKNPFPKSVDRSARDKLSLCRAVWFWALALVITVVLTLRVSAVVWQVTRLDSLVTSPWQLLALAGLPLSFLAGSAIRSERSLGERSVWAGLVALTLLASYSYLAPSFTQVVPGREPVAAFQTTGAKAAAPSILLLDAEVIPSGEVTATLTLTLTWQATMPVAQDYTVFVHLLAVDGTKIAQRDARPCDGSCPTTTWQPSAIVVDRHQISLPAGGPPGPYRLATGLYELDTGARAAVVGRDDGAVYVDVP